MSAHTPTAVLALLLCGGALLAQTPASSAGDAPLSGSETARGVLGVSADGEDVLPERLDDVELAQQRFELLVNQRWDAEWELRAAREALERHALGEVPPPVMSEIENAQDRVDRLDRKLRVLWITHGLEAPDFAAHEAAKRARSTHAFPKAAGHLAAARRARVLELVARLPARAPLPRRHAHR